MNNRGSIYAVTLVFFVFLMLFLTFFGITAFQIIITGQLNNIKNDMFLINRNVLMALQRDVMGEDKNSIYEQDVEKLIEEEIKRQWNVDVYSVTDKGFIYKVEVTQAKVISLEDKMYIESILDIELRPLIFEKFLEGKLKFKANETVKVEKMKGWSYE